MLNSITLHRAMRISEILTDTAHRTWPLPSGKWQYYQEWNNALFLHWEVPAELLRKHVPAQFTIDTFMGKAYISLVAFTMENIRPRNLPAFSPISTFEEINIRTYIDLDGKQGVYFLSMEAARSISVYISRKLSGLPYQKSKILRDSTSWHSVNIKKQFRFDAEFEPAGPILQKTLLEKWLTERYCLYMETATGLYRYDIQHCEWPLQQVNIHKLDVQYSFGELKFGSSAPDLAQYSEGVKVLAWGRQKIADL